ncbi:na(+)-translocating NADH-quinone reductase subunit C, partial [Vibrio harveyi]
SNCFANPW